MTDQEKTRVTEVIFSSDELGARDDSVVVFDPRGEPVTRTEPDHDYPVRTVTDVAIGAEPTVVQAQRLVVPVPDGLAGSRPQPAGSAPKSLAATEAVTRAEKPERRASAPAIVSRPEQPTPVIDRAPSVSFARRHLGGLTVLERKLLVGIALFVVAAMLLSYLIGFAIGLG